MMQIQKCVKPEIKGLSIIGRFRNRNKWYKKTETARKRKSPVRLAGVRKIGPQIARAHVGWRYPVLTKPRMAQIKVILYVSTIEVVILKDNFFHILLFPKVLSDQMS